jgi:hypothetical protein
VVIPHATLFSYLVIAGEVVAGLSLLLGLYPFGHTQSQNASLLNPSSCVSTAVSSFEPATALKQLLVLGKEKQQEGRFDGLMKKVPVYCAVNNLPRKRGAAPVF